MSQPSYLQQIAQRNSGSFSQLMPPRSLFQNWETPVPLEISDESPSVSTPIARSPAFPVPPAPPNDIPRRPPIQPQDAMLVTPPRLDLPKTSQAERSPEIPPATTIPKESLANPPIQLEGKTLEPSFTILSPTDPVIPNPERATLETSANTETTEPRNSSSVRSENLTAIVPRASQPPERGLPEQKPDVTENTTPPAQRTTAAAPSKNPLIEGRDRAQSPTENRPPTASPPLVRWLTPTVQDSAVEKPSPETSDREISSEAKGSPISLVDREQSPQGNTVRIGTIDIQIVPPPVVSQPAATSALSRGFASSFGLRQG